MENLSTLNNFFDGRDESWFYLITVEIEARGAAGVIPMMLATDAIRRHLNEAEERHRVQSSSRMEADSPSDDVDTDTSTASSADAAMMTLTTAVTAEVVVEDLESMVDERLLLPGVTSVDFISETQVVSASATEDSVALRYRSNSESLSRRKRTRAPPRNKQLQEGGRYLMHQFSQSPSSHQPSSGSRRKRPKFPLNEALVGDLSANRVAEYVTLQLERVAAAVKGMVESLETMREGCHPFIFYHRVRPFLSAWKQVR